MNLHPFLILNCIVYNQWFVNSPLVNTGLGGLWRTHGKIVTSSYLVHALLNNVFSTLLSSYQCVS